MARTVAMPESQRGFVEKYCVACHNAQKPEGQLRLDGVSLAIDSIESADRWQKILNQLNSGNMPPDDAKQPDRDAKTEFLDTLANTLVAARKVLNDQGGRIVMRRLNRREYKNTIRDLLGVDLRVNELPADGGAGNFDTVGSSLFMSSDQFEQYLALGRQALEEHFARFVMPTQEKPRQLHIEAEDKHARIAKSLAERVDARERYEIWTAAVEAAARKPENVALALTIRAEKPNDVTHLHSQWQRLAGAPAPKAFGFVDDVNAEQMGRRDWNHYVPHHRAYVEHPATKSGSFLTIEDVLVNPYQAFRIPGDWPAGDYVVRVRIAATKDTPAARHFVEFGSQHDTGVRAVISGHQVTGTMEKPQVLEIPLKFSPVNGHGFFFQEKGSYESENASRQVFSEAKKRNGIGPEFALWIDWIEVASAQSAAGASKTGTTRPQQLRKDPEQWANKYMPIYVQGYAEKYGRFQKWCAAIDEAAQKPENAEISKKLRAEPKIKQSPHLFYNRFAEIKGAPPPTDFGFKDVDDAQFARSEYAYHFRYYDDYQKLPQRETGAWLMLYSLGRYTGIAAPDKWPAGQYKLRVRLAASDDAPPQRRFIEIGTGKADASDFNVVSSHQVTGTLQQPQTPEIPVTINASGDRNFAIRDKRPNNREAEYAMFREAWDKTGTGPRPCIWVDFVELEGPLGTGASSSPAVAKPIKERREVELHANAMVGGTYKGYFKGGYEAAKKFLETGKPQKGIPDEQEAKFRIRGFEQHGPSFERYLNDPLTQTGAYLTIFNVHTEEMITLPPDQPSGWLKTKHEVEQVEPGDYVLRFRIGAVKGTPMERHFVALGSRMKPENREDFTLLQTFQISGTTDAPQTIEVPVSMSANGPRTFVLREKRDVKQDFEWYQSSLKATKVGPPSALWIDWVEWEGPLVKPTASPAAKTVRVEVEKMTDMLKRQITYMTGQHENFEKWKAAGAVEADLPKFGFPTRYHADFRNSVWEGNHTWFQKYVDRLEAKTGQFLDNTLNETSEVVTDLPTDLAPGSYVMRVKVGRVPDMPAERAFLTFVEASPIDKDDRTFLANKQITASLDEPEVIELPFKIRPGGPRKFILMEKRPLKKDAISLPGRTRAITDAKQREPVLWIDWLEYEGPLSTSTTTSPPPIVVANATGKPEREHARAIVERFAVRAFRDQQPSAAYLDRLVKLFETRLAAGDRFDVAIREPLSVVLASPGFLYLSEPLATTKPNPSTHAKLTPRELAVRLSYFLWSAPPDEELLDLARRGELTKPDVLARQVDRLIDSPQADEFVSGFVHQWLNMERLDFFQFDTKLHRDFDESAKSAARREVYETFAHLLRGNEQLGRLLKSDFVLVNGLLATYYGIEGVTGDAFRKVSLPADSPRGGLLGMAAILAMGSDGAESSPVERGAWVLRKLLHDPPPPAPPNVPQISRLEGKLLTTRERLLTHQEQPQCASCHRKIDPIGFGLENFNASGKWRTTGSYEKRGVGKKEWPIDPSGAFHKGPAFADFFELRELIAAREADFARGFTENLIEYALGRPYGFSDEDLAREIVASAEQDRFALRRFVQALVASEAFQLK
ncbi:MAG: DUF1592 domain-containing protein [Planctomycetaceae bacterium]|nr:DUF1592 domain-containing protein [Planctomycetaceae bacterium]